MEYNLRPCLFSDIDDILLLQNQIFQDLADEQLLRKNTKEMFMSCLQQPNLTLGIFDKEKLIALGIIYFPLSEEENLAQYTNIKYKNCANYKLCMVKKEYRGNNFQCVLGKLLEEYAIKNNVDILCSTVSPLNIYSLNNLKKLGYKIGSLQEKYGYERLIMYKLLK